MAETDMAATLDARKQGLLDPELGRGRHDAPNYEESVNQYVVASSSGDTPSGRQPETDPTSISTTGLQSRPNEGKPEIFDHPLPNESAPSSLDGNPGSLDSRSESSSVVRRRNPQHMFHGIGDRFDRVDVPPIDAMNADLGLEEGSPSSQFDYSSRSAGDDIPSQVSFNSGPLTERGSVESVQGSMAHDARETWKTFLRQAATGIFCAVAISGVIVVAYYTLQHEEEPGKASKIASIVGCVVAVTFATLVMVLLKKNFLESALFVLTIIAFIKFITN